MDDAKKNSKKSKKFYTPSVKKDKQSKVSLSSLPSVSKQISSNWLSMKDILSKENDKKAKDSSLKPKRKRKVSELDKDKDNPSKSKRLEDEIWFDDVDIDDIKRARGEQIADVSSSTNDLTLGGFSGLTKRIAIDCEFVGVGWEGKRNMLARVSIVNSHGCQVYDKYALPQEKITDYRTNVSGIRPTDLQNGVDFKTIQKEVADILKGRILIGHAVKNDLKVLLLDHPLKNIRDTSKYKPFQKSLKSKLPSLKKLSKEILHTTIQEGEHSSLQDAQAAMKLYILNKNQWEKEIKKKRFK